MNRAMPAAAALLVISALAGCGGQSGGNSTPHYGGLNPTIAVAPATANVPQGSTQQFVATVTNSIDDTVTWEVNGVVGGNLTLGTIDLNGIYTAPALIPTPAQATVTAVLNAATSFTSSSIVTVTSVVFSNSSLQGNYILSLKGIDASGAFFYAVGAITADGNGNITGGEEDLNDLKSDYAQATSVTGTYSIGTDGRGTLNLSSSLGSFSYAIALRAGGNAGLNEADNVVINATGNLELQAAGASIPSGNYAFGFAGVSADCGPLTSIGLFVLTSGAVSGMQDVNCGGTSIAQSQQLSGSYGNIDGLGRGTGSFSANIGGSDLVYYVVSANRYRFVSPDTGVGLLGSADLQTKTSFAASDFNGPFVIASSASSPGTLSNLPTTLSNMLMYISASAGNVPFGYIDINSTGAVSSDVLTGAYSVTSNGYILGTFNGTLTSFPFSMYLVSPTQAYYLDLRTGVAGSGMVYAQSTALIDKTAWAGSYATEQFGYFAAGGTITPGNSTSVSGQISANGNGGLSGTLDFNDPTDVFPGLQLTGSYTVGITVPGRTTVKLTTLNGTRNYIAYIVNQRRVQMLETDSSITAAGDALLQF